MAFGDWTPLDLKPGTDLPDQDHGRDDTGRRRTAVAGLRNGMPDVKPYRWNVAGQEREREVAARLAAIRARLAQTGPDVPAEESDA